MSLQKSKAVSANGTTLEMSTGSGSAETITGISQAAQAVVTLVGHSLTIGDVADLAAIGGMVELNGTSAPVVATTSGTVTLDVDTSEFASYSTGGTATPKTWVETHEHKTLQRNKNPRAQIDHTTLVSPAMEFKYGKKANGTMSVAINRVETEPAQQAFTIAEGEDTARTFRILKPNGWYKTFDGGVLSFGENEAVDAVADGSLEIGISGDISHFSST